MSPAAVHLIYIKCSEIRPDGGLLKMCCACLGNNGGQNKIFSSAEILFKEKTPLGLQLRILSARGRLHYVCGNVS